MPKIFSKTLHQPKDVNAVQFIVFGDFMKGRFRALESISIDVSQVYRTVPFDNGQIMIWLQDLPQKLQQGLDRNREHTKIDYLLL